MTDARGARDSAKVRVAAGNEPPKLDVDLVGSNRSFFFPGVPVRYAVRVSDREDGSLQRGTIPTRRVAVTAEHLKNGIAPSGADQSSAALLASASAAHDAGRRLIEAGTCLSCHQLNQKSIGPSYTAVAAEVSRRQHRGGAPREQDPRRWIGGVGAA